MHGAESCRVWCELHRHSRHSRTVEVVDGGELLCSILRRANNLEFLQLGVLLSGWGRTAGFRESEIHFECVSVGDTAVGKGNPVEGPSFSSGNRKTWRQQPTPHAKIVSPPATTSACGLRHAEKVKSPPRILCQRLQKCADVMLIYLNFSHWFTLSHLQDICSAISGRGDSYEHDFRILDGRNLL